MKNILVTGASKGIGKAAAIYFSANGIRVFAGYRNDIDKEMLKNLSGENIFPVQLDVTKSIQIKESINQIQHQVGGEGLHGLVNNAGIAVSGLMEYLPIDELRDQMEVNFIGLVAVTQACMPMIRRAKGRVVNISSVSGLIAFPFIAPYSASKHAVEAFTDSLRRELIFSGIHVASVQPGNVDTPIWETALSAAESIAKKYPPEATKHYPQFNSQILERKNRNIENVMHPQMVVNAIEHALFSKKPKAKYPVGMTAKILSSIGKLIPDKLMDMVVKYRLGQSDN